MAVCWLIVVTVRALVTRKRPGQPDLHAGDVNGGGVVALSLPRKGSKASLAVSLRHTETLASK